MSDALLESPSLAQLRAGDTFANGIWRLSDVQLRPSKGGQFVACQVGDATGTKPARVWKVSDEQVEILKGAPFVRASGRVESNPAYAGQLILEEFFALADVEDASLYDIPLPADWKAHQIRFRELLSSVRREELRALLKQIFAKDGEIWPRFADAPAAMNHHHNYRGGLLEHSGEVALLCERASSALRGVDRDLLVCAALLHDIGKIEELECDFASGAITYSHAGELVGHVVLGAQLIARVADGLPDFPLRLKTELTHLILSHHGEPEWGAARRPMCAEALILSQCDNLSAKFAACQSGCEGEADFSKAHNWHGRPNTPQNKVYVGRLREMHDES